MKPVTATVWVVTLSLLAGGAVLVGQTTPAAAPPPAGPTQTEAAGAARGGGRGAPRAPLTEADAAEIATLDRLPAWKPGAGDGNYFIGPDYAPAPEQTPVDGVPKGRVETFTVNAADSRFYPETGLRGATPTRQVTVYIPAQYVAGTAAPLIVSCDAYGARNNVLPTILDNMIADKRLPVMVALMVMPSDQRSLEYDTVSGRYAETATAIATRPSARS